MDAHRHAQLNQIIYAQEQQLQESKHQAPDNEGIIIMFLIHPLYLDNYVLFNQVYFKSGIFWNIIALYDGISAIGFHFNDNSVSGMLFSVIQIVSSISDIQLLDKFKTVNSFKWVSIFDIKLWFRSSFLMLTQDSSPLIVLISLNERINVVRFTRPSKLSMILILLLNKFIYLINSIYVTLERDLINEEFISLCFLFEKSQVANYSQ